MAAGDAAAAGVAVADGLGAVVGDVATLSAALGTLIDESANAGCTETKSALAAKIVVVTNIARRIVEDIIRARFAGALKAPSKAPFRDPGAVGERVVRSSQRMLCGSRETRTDSHPVYSGNRITD